MLEGGDGLGVRVEATDELRVGGDAFVEHLDGHVAFDVGLDRPEDDPGGSVVDLLQEPIPAERLPPQIESGVLLQDALVKPKKLRGGIEAQLVREDLLARWKERSASACRPSR